MTIEIMNLRNTKPCEPYDVKIDRSTHLGNPYTMTNEDQRDEVCDKCDVWLVTCCSHGHPEVIRELNRLLAIYKEHERLRLFCWCAPMRCHGESIKKLLESKIKKIERPRG